MSGPTQILLGVAQYPIVAQDPTPPAIPGGATLNAIVAVAPDTGTAIVNLSADVSLSAQLNNGVTFPGATNGANQVLSIECTKGQTLTLVLQANSGPVRRLVAAMTFVAATAIPGDLLVAGTLTAVGAVTAPNIPTTPQSILATTGPAPGSNLQNGTPSFISYAFPIDGRAHYASVAAGLRVNSTETGGQVTASFVSNGIPNTVTLFAANLAASATASFGPFACDPGSGFTVQQATALTGGSASIVVGILGF